MLSPLLSTKVLPPRRSRGTLPRPRLEQLIERIADSSITVLSAPPGFGKSTLASTWAEAAQARGAKVAWLNMDEADTSAERVLLYVTAALQRGFGQGDDGNLLMELSLLPAEHLSTLLVNDLERRTEQCYLFVDDYHCVPPAVMVAAFDSLVRFAPDNFHLVFCGRGDLPASLLAHIYADAYLEVDAAQLRFDLDETHDLMLRTGEASIDAAQLMELHSATDGWIAALRASLLTLRQRPSGSTRVANSISSLMDELVDRLPATLAIQLSRLAAIDKFNITLAEMLTGTPNGAALIDDLDRRQLFLITLDDHAQWFSFHPLFREHLRRRVPSAELSAILERTAQWYAGQRLWMDAVHAALACGDIDSARNWIAHCAMEMVEHGDFILLLDWQRQLRDRLLESPVQLKLALGWAAGLAMDSPQARAFLNEVHQALPGLADDNQRTHLEWECQALDAMLLALEDKSQAGGTLASACLPHLKDRPWISNTLLNVLSFSHLQACRWQEFYSMPAMIRAPLEPNRYQFNQIYRMCLLGYAEALQGRLLQAATILEEALRMTSPGHGEGGDKRHPVLRALPSGLLVAVDYLLGNFKEAARLSMENIETVKITGFLDCACWHLITASRLSGNTVGRQGARYFLEEGHRLANTRSWPRLQAHLLLERTRVCLLEQKNLEANACANQLQALCLTHAPDIADGISEYACLASLADLWCEACGLHRNANLEKAEELRQRTQQRNLRLMQLRLASSLAIVHWQRRATVKASAYITEAAELLEHCNAPQGLLDLPAQESLQQILAYIGQLPKTNQEVKKRLQQLIISDATNVDSPSASHQIIKLTSKERNVLELVAQGKSNKEIAKLLGVTPETIKSHMKHIFSKLQVDSRAQAAVVAKAGGLIHFSGSQ
ncbi:hypothetical protein I9018_24430 [Pseudomonas sp. MPFS]|uniref:LuxR C-terminal-related transcriptional regulator n=1 Tax=Pseudomonas sp. MPFS TaxID=2795724 RepID=UPI001F129CF9|nr:LuxR C-terminal-related transcriptional regulator [Pseudomonas sp. MPFS]UMZ10610.1 hypothetical protein I9018_24430 [Pseudomonas sp. MPFS]